MPAIVDLDTLLEIDMTKFAEANQDVLRFVEAAFSDLDQRDTVGGVPLRLNEAAAQREAKAA